MNPYRLMQSGTLHSKATRYECSLSSALPPTSTSTPFPGDSGMLSIPGFRTEASAPARSIAGPHTFMKSIYSISFLRSSISLTNLSLRSFSSCSAAHASSYSSPAFALTYWSSSSSSTTKTFQPPDLPFTTEAARASTMCLSRSLDAGGWIVVLVER